MASTKFKSLKGMPDILPEDVWKWQYIESSVRNVFRQFNYTELRTPILESLDLFQRSIGQETDIVQKEMFQFQDRGQRNVVLRPEVTASVVRAYIEHQLAVDKLFYIGASFRAERPQAGRFRQFHQIGAEFIGAKGAEDDVAILALMQGLLMGLGLKDYVLEINSLGCKESRAGYRKKLKDYLQSYISNMSEDSQRRIETNVIRVLDSKDPRDQEIIKKAPSILESLLPKSKEHLEQVKEILEQRNIPYRINTKIVRGLDYYNDIVYEITHPALGAQNAIGAGGRYDSLVGELGGSKDCGACGFALGIERLIVALEGDGVWGQNQFQNALVYMCVFGDSPDIKKKALEIQSELRKDNFSVEEISFKEVKMKKHFQRADRLNARVVILQGEDEFKEGQVSIKDMKTGTQEKVQYDSIKKVLKGILT